MKLSKITDFFNNKTNEKIGKKVKTDEEHNDDFIEKKLVEKVNLGRQNSEPEVCDEREATHEISYKF